MFADIEVIVKGGNHCIQTAANPTKIPLNPWSDSGKVWSWIHTDFSEQTTDRPLVVVVNSFTKYIDAQWLRPLTSQPLIKYLRRLFRHFGPPETIVSDNGRQFTSLEFARFCEEFNIIHFRCVPGRRRVMDRPRG